MTVGERVDPPSRAGSQRGAAHTHHADGDDDPSRCDLMESTDSRRLPRKRKKRFKYMLENQAGGNGDGKDGEGDDGDDGQDGEGKKESRKKVKKACIFCKRSHMPCEEARPCRRCIKRGIPDLCRDAEPQGTGGRQASSSKSSKPSGSGSSKGKGRSDGTSNEGRESTSPEAEELDIPGVSARDPDFKPAMSISLLLSPAEVSTTRMSQASIYADAASGSGPSAFYKGAGDHSRARDLEPSRQRPPSSASRHAGYSSAHEQAHAQEREWNRNMDHLSQRELKRLLEAGPSAVDLNDAFGDKPTSLLNHPIMIGLPVGDPLMMPSAGNSPSPTTGSNSEYYDERTRDGSYHVGSTSSLARPRPGEMYSRPKHILQEEHATTAELRGIKSYSYTYGYAKLARWMQTRFSRESCEAVDRCLGQLRPKFLAISRSLPERELIAVEEAFIRLVHHYQANVLEFVPLPTLICRRTGEIYAANEHAARFFQLPKSLFEGGQISHFQTVPEHEAVKLWELYAQECMGVLKDPPLRVSSLEIDRSLLLFNKPGFDPHSGELLGDGSGLCEDGSPAVIRKRCLVSFEAKISQHGLPVMLIGQYMRIPDEIPDAKD